MLWITATVAMFGSLYFSEVKGYEPCGLCWYQRILMYPLAVITMIAILRNDKKVVRYVFPLSIVGMGLSLFHYGKQKISWFNEATDFCSTSVPCNTMYVEWLGFITIPLMAFTAFTIINVLCFLIIREDKKEGETE